MGVGKSTIGQLLAESLSLPFYDIDLIITQKTGQSIAQIFSEKGEVSFRDLESDAILSLADQSPGVVALGGGALMNAESLRFIKDVGYLIYLSAELSTLQARLVQSNQTRPLLDSLSAELRSQKIASLLSDREVIYKTADLIIHTDEKEPQTVVNDVLQKLKRGQA